MTPAAASAATALASRVALWAAAVLGAGLAIQIPLRLRSDSRRAARQSALAWRLLTGERDDRSGQ